MAAPIEMPHGRDLELETVITFDGDFVARQILTASDPEFGTVIDLTGGKHLSYVWGVRTWTPQNPDLYDIEFKLSFQGEVQDDQTFYE